MTSVLAGVAAEALRVIEVQRAGEEQREIELTQAERWARDPLGWLNAGHVWIASKFGEEADELAKVRPVRLRLFTGQEAMLADWIDLDLLARTGELRFRNMADEKSRQQGETWGFAGAICWILHYHVAAGGVMHRKGGEVDDGGERNTWRSLFGKIRYIDQRLDRSRVPGLGRLAFRPFSREPAKIENTRNGSVVYGEGQSDDPFRGLTLDYLFGDEFAFVEHGESVYASIDEACPNGKALASTVNGDGNVHARIVDQKPQGWRIGRRHWSDHPIYAKGLHVAGEDPDCPLCEGNRRGHVWNPQEPQAHRFAGRLVSPWYDQRVIGKTDEQVANELDIDRARALGGRVYREFSDDLHVVPAGIPYEQALMAKTELAWDFGLDVTSIVVCQDAPNDYRVIGLLEMGDLFGTTATPERVSEALRLYLADLGVPEMFLASSWTRRLHCVGDPSGGGRELSTAQPLVNAYRRLGWQIGRPAWRYCRSVEPSLASVKRLLLGTPKPLRVCGVNAAEFATHMRNNVWATDRTGQRRPGGGSIVDDVHNHACRAFAYLTVAKWPPPATDFAEPAPAPLPEDPRVWEEIVTSAYGSTRGEAREPSGVLDRGVREHV